MSGRNPSAAEDARAFARELRRRAVAESLPNVRANYEAAASRWIAIAERTEQLDQASGALRRRLGAERMARGSATPS